MTDVRIRIKVPTPKACDQMGLFFLLINQLNNNFEYHQQVEHEN